MHVPAVGIALISSISVFLSSFSWTEKYPYISLYNDVFSDVVLTSFLIL